MGKFLSLGRARNHGKLNVNPVLSGGWDEAVSQLDRQPVIALDANPIEAALRKALADDSFYLDFQPVFDLGGKVTEVEALLRSQEPLLQKTGPYGYIRVAEESNLILRVGERVLLMACRSLAEWRKLGLEGITMAVNVSCMQLVSPGFGAFALGLLKEHGIPPSAIHMEVTETTLTRDVTSMLAEMTLLVEAGVCFSIDDFGTGYSTLERLSRLPVSTMKIDQSFVREMQGNSRMCATIRGMVDLAGHLGLNVIAEGVETQAQFELLQGAGCRKFQGYLFSRPVGTEQIRELLAANQPPVPQVKDLAQAVGY